MTGRVRAAAATAAGTPSRRAGPTAQQRALKVIGSVVAPAALLTALMYLFGLSHAFWFFGRFGVEYTLMGLTTQDYLVRSADGLFVPLTTVAVVGLAALWATRCLPTSVVTRGRRWSRRVAVPGAIVVGAVLLSVAVIGIADPARFTGSVGVPGLSLTVGVLLFTAASGSRRRVRSTTPAVLVAEWIAIFLLVSTGLFWATTDYSASVGTQRAEQLIAALPAWPDAVLYSEKSLNLGLPGVREQRCADADGAYAFRYDGLKLIVQSGGQLFLLPSAWVDATGAAVVLPRTDALRWEFTAPGQSGSGRC